MCDRTDLANFDRLGWTRRGFGMAGITGALGIGLAGCSTMASGDIDGLHQRNVSFSTADGTLDGILIAPVEGRHPAVIMWPDIAGVRPAKVMMARRTAADGFAVLLVNPYYRDVTGQQFEDFAAFRESGGFEKVGPWRGKLKADAIRSDTRAIVDWLDGQGEVDTTRGIGTEGYCMGGPFTVWSAVGRPDRVRAATSFHGGGLAEVGNPNSPHNLLGQSRAAHLFAIAQNDDAKEPDAKDRLRAAAEKADLVYELEVYGADHGWMVPDSPAYSQAEAERGYARKMAFYDRL